MANALAALRLARSYLKDINAITYTDAHLMPLLQVAFGEMIQELELNDIGTVRRTSAAILVPALEVTLPFQPVDIVVPIDMMERRAGSTSKDEFVDMQGPLNYLPADDPYIDRLRYWSFNAEIISFVGCRQNREVQLRYDAALSAPNKLTDPLGFIFAEQFIGPKIASLMLASNERDNTYTEAAAQKALYKLIQTNVVGDQRPVRRRPYRARKIFGWANVGVSSTPAPIPESEGIENMAFIAPQNPPDGIATNFNFLQLPKFLVYNGLILFETIGYSVVVSGLNYVVTIKDILGNTITPANTDVIREAV